MIEPGRSPDGRTNHLPVLIAVLLVCAAYLSSGLAGAGNATSPMPVDYYGHLTHAFMHGQLHLDITIDPGLLALENPYAGPQGALRPHDMSYYRGRFYLYYGAAPVIILFLPWRCLTGSYLHESMGSMLMLIGAVILAASLLMRVHRRWFPAVSVWWLFLVILVIGFSPPLFTELHNNTFYAVPIVSAAFCLLLAFAALDRALAAGKPEAQAGWLAAASLAWGLSVGCRPTYVLGLTLLALPALWLWWRSGPRLRWRWPGLRLIAAAVVPAATVGLVIAAYNFMRFDDPLDFGIRYSMASGDLREARLIGAEFIRKNLHAYLLATGDFIRYYPFVHTAGSTFGIVPHLPFTILAVLLPLSWMPKRGRDGHAVLLGLVLLGAGASNFGLLCLFFGDQERYLVDFCPPLLLLAASAALAVLAAARRLRWRTARLGIGLLVFIPACYAIATGFLLGFPRRADASRWLWLERWLNLPACLAEQRAGEIQGPIELDVEFPPHRVGATEPLITTGNLSGSGDIVAVHYLDDTHIQFSAFHVGRGGPVSDPIKIDYGARHRVRIALGSLYPPPGHPAFGDWSLSQINRVRRRLEIELDGVPVLQGNLTVYPSTPAGVTLGHSRLAPDVAGAAFTGRIVSSRRLGLNRAEAAGHDRQEGPVRLTLRFPPRSGDEGLPLIATGGRDKGDLLYAQLLGSGLVRFGHDSFGSGAIVSPAVAVDSSADHVLEVEMGSLYSHADREADPVHQRRLRIKFDGMTLLDTSRPFNPSKPDEVEFGFNTIRASTAIEYFPGTIRRVESIPPAQPWDPRRQPAQWGPLRLIVEFPQFRNSSSEPLLVTGHTGRADILLVRYEADGTLRFGLDHWGVGLALSEPIGLDRTEPQILEIWSDALLPPEGDPWWVGRSPELAARLPRGFEVRLAGKPVLRPGFAPYSNARNEVAFGENLIGASSCEQRFHGRFLVVERLEGAGTSAPTIPGVTATGKTDTSPKPATKSPDRGSR